MLWCGAWSDEQHLSSGALLSGGLSVAGAMSSGYELVVHRAAAYHRLSGVSERVLLSEQRDDLGDEAMSLGLLLSERYVESHDVQESGMSYG